VPVSASIGIALYPDNAVELDELLRRAERAMRVAKREGLGFARFFRSAMLVETMAPTA
jgi:predicted signal transduction protein with EAL and GGDEF domain